MCGGLPDGTAPADGALVFHPAELVVFGVDATATAAVTAPGDVPVVGTTAWADEMLVFTPAAPFATATDYAWSVTTCAGTNTGTFTTAPALDGRTYGLQLGAGAFTPSLLQSLFGFESDTLLGVTSAGAGGLELLAASTPEGDPLSQDPCVATATALSGFGDRPQFTAAGQAPLPLRVQDVGVALDPWTVSGTFAADGESVVDVAIAGSLDTRPLVPLVDPTGGDGALCDLIQSFGLVCGACPGGGDFCLDVSVSELTGARVDGLTLQPRSAPDPACSP